jgi:5'-3' exoribonuclease 2
VGVPAFFRWCAEKYPKVIRDAIEWDPSRGPVDLMAPNPNGTEFDNLYLDMNGIIHPCVHPEGREAPKTEEEVQAQPPTPVSPSQPRRSPPLSRLLPAAAQMFLLIFEYIDRIFSVIRPRKLLYMAIDGPAPRAKMNQQRSRRFKAAKERAEKAAVEAELDAEMRANGHDPPPPEGGGFDSNVITPGTAFMGRLAKWLQYYTQARIHSEPAWAGIKASAHKGRW